MTTTSSTTSSNSMNALSDYLTKQKAAKAADASTTSSSSNASQTDANIQEVTGKFSTFIKILTTQLQHQDPTAATDTNQFTQELVMFSQVEQQLATNKKLDTISTNIGGVTTSAMMNYVGNYVESNTTTSKLVVQDGVGNFAYSLSDTPTSVAISIKNSSGSTVASMSGPTSTGLHRVEWDGKETSGSTADDGTYTIVVKETGADGTTKTVSNVYLVGKVTAMNIDSTNGNTLSIGDQTIKESEIGSAFSSIGTSKNSTTTS